LKKIKQKGVIVIRDIVEDEEAISWRKALEKFVKVNPNVEGKRLQTLARISIVRKL